MKIIILLTLFGQSKTLPLATSAIIPGMGEWIMGARRKAEPFFWIDGALWLTYGGFTYYGRSQLNNSKLFARRYAGASLSRNDKYYEVLERYDNSDEYNEDVLREARDRYPDSMENAVELRNEYLKEHGYFGDDSWDWKPDSLRIYEYHTIRTRAREALQRASFTLGALLANRVISFIDCALFTEDKRFSKRMGFAPTINRPGIAFVLKF